MAASKNPATNLEYWTEFFHRANGSIFDVIENAIAVAANDFPQELRSRRDRIVEKIYTAAIPRCFSCIERCNQQLEEAGSVKHERENREKGKEGPEDIGRMVVSGSGGSNCSYDNVEAITEEIERETEIVGEVLRIKECLLTNLQEQSESSVLEHLRKLQLMELSVQTMKATEIGKAVNGLRKHKSKKVKQLARILIEGWKELVDEWVSSTALLEDKHEELECNAAEEEEEGLPSPPLDEGAFFATQTTAIHLDQLFDGMDDDGNLKSDSEIEKKGETERNSLSRSKGPVTSQEQPRSMIKKTQPSSLHNNTQMNLPLKNVSKPSRSVKVESGPGRPPHVTQNLSAPVQRKPPAVAHDKLKSSEDDKLEAAKKRLHEGYQQAQNAKKQRTIQMLNEKEIPKPKMVPQHRFNSHNQKPKSGIRSWAARH